jgi:hypothetical protein
MKIGAYVLAGDPAWVEDSVGSYYDLVDHIVVAYDQDGLSWSGDPLPVDEALARLRAVDRDGKLIELPGRFSDPTRPALALDTAQRQAALDRAGVGVDWVLQLDTDEIVASPERLLACLRRAEAVGADSLDYPLRFFYQRSGDRFLELSRRFWGPRAGYPGPVAVRPGAHLALCRQTRASVYRVDFRARNTDPWNHGDVRVDEVIPLEEGIVHMSWVRTREQMLSKSSVSGHASERDWPAVLQEWDRAARHPRLMSAMSVFSRKRDRHIRLTAAPVPLRGRDWYEPHAEPR